MPAAPSAVHNCLVGGSSPPSPTTQSHANRAKGYREILIPNGGKDSDIRPLRPETRAKLVSAIARGRLWLAEMQSGAVANVQDIAARENCSKRHVNEAINVQSSRPGANRKACAHVQIYRL